MSITDDEIYVCDFCGDDTGRFNSETGNHESCEKLSALQSALTTAQEENKRYKLALDIFREISNTAPYVGSSYVKEIVDDALNGGK